MNSNHLLRHCLATVAFRADVAFQDAPVEYPTFDAGNDVRAPIELLHHMTQILLVGVRAFGGSHRVAEELMGWSTEIDLFRDAVHKLDVALAQGTSPQTMTEEVLLQGPLADCLTHVGQLIMLRRLCGSPTQAISYLRAEISSE